MFCISLQVVTGCTKFLAFFVTPTLAARSRVPPAVCPSLLENATTDSVCTSFLQSLSAYVHTEIPHTYILPFCNLFPHTYIRRFHIRTYADASSILRFSPAPQTPDLHTSNLPLYYPVERPTRHHPGSQYNPGELLWHTSIQIAIPEKSC